MRNSTIHSRQSIQDSGRKSEATLSGIAHQLGSLYALVLHLKLGGSQLSLEMLNDHTLMS